MVDVLWKAPALSKQVVVGLRDTALVPGDIGYYTDRYGIVQSNFPDKIRMGDAQDVRDVPHPVSAGAPMLYSYRVRDSLTLSLPGRRESNPLVRLRQHALQLVHREVRCKGLPPRLGFRRPTPVRAQAAGGRGCR